MEVGVRGSRVVRLEVVEAVVGRVMMRRLLGGWGAVALGGLRVRILGARVVGVGRNLVGEVAGREERWL